MCLIPDTYKRSSLKVLGGGEGREGALLKRKEVLASYPYVGQSVSTSSQLVVEQDLIEKMNVGCRDSVGFVVRSPSDGPVGLAGSLVVEHLLVASITYVILSSIFLHWQAVRSLIPGEH